jgi:hypothetical protein
LWGELVELLERALASSALVVAVDPGKVSNRVWLASGAQAWWRSRYRSRCGARHRGLGRHDRGERDPSGIPGPPVIGIQATGGLHHAWMTELERRSPGSVRLFAPSQTRAARAQLGWRRHKPDD